MPLMPACDVHDGVVEQPGERRRAKHVHELRNVAEILEHVQGFELPLDDQVHRM